ncbi:hypothetical protein HPB50_004504 [Hyalomma asiaticum]|uniref:Uncharacterized protein n=1 Tax=Hyalomma asiaticum TaxID=266040 RepID=A0ACB7SJ77_HYAAI|nr:hypothetical protein HPB50_004504 [Hyalomma asiaticum]
MSSGVAEEASPVLQRRVVLVHWQERGGAEGRHTDRVHIAYGDRGEGGSLRLVDRNCYDVVETKVIGHDGAQVVGHEYPEQQPHQQPGASSKPRYGGRVRDQPDAGYGTSLKSRPEERNTNAIPCS